MVRDWDVDVVLRRATCDVLLPTVVSLVPSSPPCPPPPLPVVFSLIFQIETLVPFSSKIHSISSLRLRLRLSFQHPCEVRQVWLLSLQPPPPLSIIVLIVVVLLLLLLARSTLDLDLFEFD
jgi:hypothetical protein